MVPFSLVFAILRNAQDGAPRAACPILSRDALTHLVFARCSGSPPSFVAMHDRSSRDPHAQARSERNLSMSEPSLAGESRVSSDVCRRPSPLIFKEPCRDDTCSNHSSHFVCQRAVGEAGKRAGAVHRSRGHAMCGGDLPQPLALLVPVPRRREQARRRGLQGQGRVRVARGSGARVQPSQGSGDSAGTGQGGTIGAASCSSSRTRPTRCG